MSTAATRTSANAAKRAIGAPSRSMRASKSSCVVSAKKPRAVPTKPRGKSDGRARKLRGALVKSKRRCVRRCATSRWTRFSKRVSQPMKPASARIRRDRLSRSAPANAPSARRTTKIARRVCTRVGTRHDGRMMMTTHP